MHVLYIMASAALWFCVTAFFMTTFSVLFLSQLTGPFLCRLFVLDSKLIPPDGPHFLIRQLYWIER